MRRARRRRRRALLRARGKREPHTPEHRSACARRPARRVAEAQPPRPEARPCVARVAEHQRHEQDLVALRHAVGDRDRVVGARGRMQVRDECAQELERLAAGRAIDAAARRPESLAHESDADREERAVGVVVVERDRNPARRRTQRPGELRDLRPRVGQCTELRIAPEIVADRAHLAGSIDRERPLAPRPSVRVEARAHGVRGLVGEIGRVDPVVDRLDQSRGRREPDERVVDEHEIVGCRQLLERLVLEILQRPRIPVHRQAVGLRPGGGNRLERTACPRMIPGHAAQ